MPASSEADSEKLERISATSKRIESLPGLVRTDDRRPSQGRKGKEYPVERRTECSWLPRLLMIDRPRNYSGLAKFR